MKIVLTRATSYLGKRLLLELFYFSHKTVCTIRDKSRFSAHTSLSGKIEVIEVDLRDAYAFGGGLHCCTADVHREGSCEDYFPNSI